MKSFFRREITLPNSIYATIFSAQMKLAALLISILAARELGTADFGIAVTMLTSASVVAVVGNNWATNLAVLRSSGGRTTRELAPGFPVTQVAIICGASSVVFMFLLGLFFNDAIKHQLTPGMIAAAVGYLVLQILSTASAAACQILGNGKLLVITLLAPLATILLVTPSASRSIGVTGMLIASSLPHAFLTVVCSLVLYKQVGFENSMKRIPHVSFFADMNLTLLLSPLFLAISHFASTVFILSAPNGASEVGLFNSAYQWKAFMLFVPMAVGSLQLAHLKGSQYQSSNKTQLVRAMRLSWINLLSAVVPIGLVLLFGNYLLALYGSSFVTAAPLLSWIAASAVVTCFSASFEKAMLANNKSAEWATITGFGATAYCAISYAFRDHGAAALTIGILACLLLQAILGYFVLRYRGTDRT